MNIKEEINNLLDFKEIEGSSEKNEALSKIAEQHAIEFAKWCLRNVKKAPSSKKYVFKHQNKVVADEHTIGELYKVFIIDKEYNF